MSDCPKFPPKPKEAMWIEKHGRLAPPKNESETGEICPKSPAATAIAACLQIYQPPQNQAVSTIDTQINLKKLILENPVLRRGKSPTEIARFQSELAQLESERGLAIDAEPHTLVDDLARPPYNPLPIKIKADQ